MANFNAREFNKYAVRSFIGLVIFCFVLLIVLNTLPIINILSLSKQIKSDVEKIKVVAEKKDFKGILDVSISLNKESKDLRDNVNSIKIINYIPTLNKNINSLDQLSELAILATDSYIKIYPIIEKNLSTISGGADTQIISMPKDQKAKLISSLTEYKDSIDQIEKNVYKMSSIIDANKNNKGLVKPLQDVWISVNTKLSFIDDAKQIMPIVNSLPELLGSKKTAKYLLLFQNNTELRPTGGFIGTYGILSIKDGDITSIFTDNTYNLDGSAISRVNITPPKALKDYLKINKLYLRDANWNPDYVQSAEFIEDLYKKESQNQSDITGVIAITPTVLQNIIGYFGDIKAMGMTFNKENATDLLNYETKFGYWDKQGISTSQRKIIIQKLTDVLFEKIKSLSLQDMKDLFKVVSQDLEKKQMLLYFDNDSVEKFVLDNNWGGEMVQNNNSDYIAVVDTNVLSGKADPYIDRNLDYDLRYVGDDLVATLSLTYTHKYEEYLKNEIYQDEPSYLDFYKSYTRVYVPQGSWLNSIFRNEHEISTKDIEFKQENGKSYFGFYLSIPKNETATYKLEYKVPKELEAKFQTKYSLIYQKQSGIVGNKLNINIDLNKAVKSASIENNKYNEVSTNYYNKKFNLNGFAITDKVINIDLYSDSDMSYLKQIIKLNYLSFNKEAPLGN